MSVVLAKLSSTERDEAIYWLEDCGLIDLDAAGIINHDVIPNSFLIRALTKHYDGGFYSFRLATGDVELSVRERLTLEYGEDWASAIEPAAELVNTYRTDHEDVITVR
ncbi:MAG: hypothetical protein EON54_15500, partial [Alcaligenaceae bacterium]